MFENFPLKRHEEYKQQTPGKYVGLKESEKKIKTEHEKAEDLNKSIDKVAVALQEIHPELELEKSDNEFILVFKDPNGHRREFHFHRGDEMGAMDPKGNKFQLDIDKGISARVFYPDGKMYDAIHNPEFVEFWKKYKPDEGKNKPAA